MSQAYFDYIDELNTKETPFRDFTLQFAFIFYLLLGQVIVLFVWRLLTRRARGEPTRGGMVAFAVYIFFAQAALFLAWPWLVGLWLTSDRILLADIVVTFHFGLVVAAILVIFLILVGWPLGWRWTRNFWFRLTHLMFIEIVAGQRIVGLECPLITIERELRGGPGQLKVLDGASAIGAFCNQALYVPNQHLVLVLCYIAVAMLVLLTWVLVPPRLPWRMEQETPKLVTINGKQPDQANGAVSAGRADVAG